MTVKYVAETRERHRKAKYDIATPRRHETASAPPDAHVHWNVPSVVGSAVGGPRRAARREARH